MIYVDTSVALAQLLAEDRCPPDHLWQAAVVSSRLTEYEVWTRVHARGLGPSHGESVRQLLGRLAWLELTPVVLARALEPWPTTVRTLDALHLASIEFLRHHGQDVTLASYDDRMTTAATSLAIPLFALL
jgi:predicted nucleic acid-binding protein